MVAEDVKVKQEDKKMKFILSTKGKQKNAKRHIVSRSEDIDYLRKVGKKYINDRYIVEIYTGNWQLIERVK